MINLKDIQEAHKRIAPHIHHTPLLTSLSLNEIAGAQLFFKCENLQKIGAFKIRGAMNAVLSLPDKELNRGVATHSSGNHAQALALAAALRKIPAYIVMPRTSPKVKIEGVKKYGGQITFCEPTLQAREETLERIVKETGATFIHPFDNPVVIAGQGTVALEMLEDRPDLDFIVAPVGGGGLLSGTSIAAKELKPSIKVIGAEPSGANDAFKSLRDGKIYPPENHRTIADGLLTSLSDLTFTIIRKNVDEIMMVDDEDIKKAMKLIWARMKLVAEPSGAVPLAVVLKNPKSFAGKNVGIIISGGNVDWPL